MKMISFEKWPMHVKAVVLILVNRLYKRRVQVFQEESRYFMDMKLKVEKILLLFCLDFKRSCIRCTPF